MDELDQALADGKLARAEHRKALAALDEAVASFAETLRNRL